MSRKWVGAATDVSAGIRPDRDAQVVSNWGGTSISLFAIGPIVTYIASDVLHGHNGRGGGAEIMAVKTIRPAWTGTGRTSSI